MLVHVYRCPGSQHRVLGSLAQELQVAGWSRVGATVRSSVRQYMFLTVTSPAPNPQFLKYVILCWITLIASSATQLGTPL